MRKLMGVNIGIWVKEKEKVFLCFDWAYREEEGASCIKARYGNRKFFTTIFKTKDTDSIMLLRWKNDPNGHSYEMRKPEISRRGDLIRLDLTKEFAAMGMELKENDELYQIFQSGGCSRSYYDYKRLRYGESRWINVGEHGYYYAECFGAEDSINYLNFCFAYPGVKIGNSLITKIEIQTFDSISCENMDPFYDFMGTVMDEPLAVSRYTEAELVQLFTKHFPLSMHMNIWCNDKLLRASIDHLGNPQFWFEKNDIVNGIIDYNSKRIETKTPLEMVVKELGL